MQAESRVRDDDAPIVVDDCEQAVTIAMLKQCADLRTEWNQAALVTVADRIPVDVEAIVVQLA